MIKFFNIYEQDKEQFHKNLSDFKSIVKKTNFINGKTVNQFEKSFAKFCNTRYAVGCNSGSDALFLALKSLNLKNDIPLIKHVLTYFC